MPPVPAKRYDIFITAFEKFVTERQEEIKKVDRLMRPYELVRNVLESLKLENDTRLELTTDGVYVRIPLLDTDTKEHVDAIVAAIGQALRPIHEDGIPATCHISLKLHYYWRLHRIAEPDKRPPDANLEFEVPREGTQHINVTKEEESTTYTYTTYKMTWIEQDDQDSVSQPV